jgi:hypothetical protein
MRTVKTLLIAAAMLLGAMAGTNAVAGGGWHGGGWHGHTHVGVGVVIGAPYFYSPWYYPYPYYYPAPYYYPPAGYGYPSGPTSYVEQGPQESAQGQAPQQGQAPHADNYWYYCPDSKTYYPYVKQCAGGWQRVSPQPPS